MGLVRTALLAVLALSFGCKGTEGCLSDLVTSTDEGESRMEVYDADLLIHEAFVGIMRQEVLTLSQMGRAAHHCARIIEKNKSALLRADAVSLLAHLALRYPIPPLTEPFSQDVGADAAPDAINALDAALKPLEAEHRINGLTHPDKAVAEENWFELRKLFPDLRLPLDADAWESWWEKNRAGLVAAAQEKGRAPLETLAYLRYGSLTSSRAVLGYLATRLAVSDLPDLREGMQAAQVRLARLVVEYGIVGALRDESPIVRAEAARAARRVLAADFGEKLTDVFAREVNPEVKVQILKTLEWYPGRSTLEFCLLALSDTERPVALTSRGVLASLAGKDLGDHPAAWHVWWEREGKIRWP
ncbi:MAG: hypothetical protein HRU14_08645 [Planctomycetes bacterium]|nr:hypothetical protein [Planctomycetota bacterium]